MMIMMMMIMMMMIMMMMTDNDEKEASAKNTPNSRQECKNYNLCKTKMAKPFYDQNG